MASITVEDLVGSNADGVFDKLMEAVQKSLVKEFSEGRITATEYSKVFLSVTDTVLAQSMQFLLQKDQSAKQVEVLEAQRMLAVAQEQAVQKEVLLTEANITKLNKEITMLDDQQQLLQAQVLLVEAQVSESAAKTEILLVEKNKTAAEVDLVNANVNKTNKDVEVLTAQLVNIPKEGQIMDKQVTKTESEIVFLNQRIKTEKAQILDDVDGVPVAGILGKQRTLYQAQTNGFNLDSKQKVTKMLVDTWVVRRSTDDGIPANTTNKLDDAYIGASVEACMVGAGITLP